MSKRNINHIARLLGISTTAIRKYEEKGLVTIDRNAGNKYRELSVDDVGALIRIRQLRQSGFSLDEIYNVMYDSEAWDIRDRIISKQAELQQEIERFRQMELAMDNWLSDIDDMGGELSWVEMPALWFSEYMEVTEQDVRVVDSIDNAQRGLAAMPVSFPGLLISGQMVQESLSRLCYSVGVFSTDAHSAEDKLWSGGTCASFSSCNAFETNRLLEVEERICAAGYHLSGDIMAKVTMTLHHNDPLNYRCWHRFYFPVQKSNKSA